MWQRFSESARKIVFYAQEEAERLGENYVSTEHLLLAMTHEESTGAGRVISGLGVSLDQIRLEVERQLARGDGRPGQDKQLTPRAKRVIDLAYDEARQLSHDYIGTEHLLLGLVREGEGLAGRVLAKLGINLELVRETVMQLTDQEREGNSRAPKATGGFVSQLRDRVWPRKAAAEQTGAEPEPTPAAESSQEAASPGVSELQSQVLDRVLAMAGRNGAEYSARDLAVALLSETTGRAARVLSRLTVDPEHLLLALRNVETPAPAESGSAAGTSGSSILSAAREYSRAVFQDAMLGSDHVLLALTGDAALGPILSSAGITHGTVVKEMLKIRDDEG